MQFAASSFLFSILVKGKKDGMRKRSGFILLASLLTGLLFLLSSAKAQQGQHFTIQIPAEGIAGYQNNPLMITAPESGTVTLEIRDETTLYRRLEETVPPGKSQLIWDGLGWNEERMQQKQYTVFGVFTGESGAQESASAAFRMNASLQAVLFALPSSPDVYPDDQGDWFLEYKLIYSDLLTAEFYDAESSRLILKTEKAVRGGRVNQIFYSALSGKKTLPEGKYRVRVYGKQHPSRYKEFDLTVKTGSRPLIPLCVTGEIMPDRDDEDDEIWKKMTAPATIVDIRNTAHQTVYEKPDRNSRTLGTLHGQSQALSVLEIRENWVRISAWNHECGEPIEGWVPRKNLKVVEPQTEYGILVDKKAQTLTLYHQGKKVDTLLVSTGRMSKGELYQETAAGSFLTNYHMSDYSTNGLKYDFVIRYDGGNLLHQIPYAWSESGKKDMNPGELVLGTKASHACIRIQEKPGENGLNAYWFWVHIPYRTRVIVLDDPEEREKLKRIVTGETPDLKEGLSTAWKVETQPEEEELITLTFGGDVVLGGRESYYGLPEGLPSYLETNGMAWPFSSLSEIFKEDDATIVNLECVLQDDPTGEDITRPWRFRGLTKYAEALTEGGIDMVNLANNHTIDYGEGGYVSTVQALKDSVLSCGNGINTVVNIRGTMFGFGGCRETTYRSDPNVIERDIRDLREQGAEYVIYQCHWGTEYDGHHNVLQEAMARACRRAGADLVIGHHPHVVQGIDWIDGMPVVYSLGNLMFGGTIRLTSYDAVLVQLIYYPQRTENRTELRLIPVLTSSSSDKRINDYRPVPAEGSDALRILQKIQQDTGFLITEKALVHY